MEESLYERFGDQIRTTPRAEGWGLAAYVIPVVAFVLFGGVVLLVLRRLVGQRAPQAEGSVEPSARPAPIAVGAHSAGTVSDAELERLVDEEFGA